MILNLKNGNTLSVSIHIEQRNNQYYLMDEISVKPSGVQAMFSYQLALKWFGYELEELESIEQDLF